MVTRAGLPTRTGDFIRVDLSAVETAHAAWTEPLRSYFRRSADGWKLVGLERAPI